MVDDVYDGDRPLLTGRVLGGAVTRNAILRNYQRAPVRVLAVEFEETSEQVRLLVETEVGVPRGDYLRA